jgi:hypothetical protein
MAGWMLRLGQFSNGFGYFIREGGASGEAFSLLWAVVFLGAYTIHVMIFALYSF